MDIGEVIVAALSLVGTALGAYSGARLTGYRISQLEKSVDKLSSLAARIPVNEEKIISAHEKIEDLEKAVFSSRHNIPAARNDYRNNL